MMLTNRPEFHFADTAAMHLGATPFSVYNTYSAEQIEYLVGDAARPDHRHRAGVPRRASLAVQKACGSLKHVIVVDGDGARGRAHARRGRWSRATTGFDFEAVLARRRSRTTCSR